MNKVRIKLAVLSLSAVLPFVSPAAAAVIGPNGNSYEVIRADGITWVDADAAASALGKGWHLATVCDATENDFIESLRKSAGLGQVWLGGYQDAGGADRGGFVRNAVG